MSVAPLIRPAEPADIDAVCTFLHERMNRRIAPERWRRLMTYRWMPARPDLGRVVEAGGRVRGYVGMVYADRTIGARNERVVNICAWYLAPALRGRGLGAELMSAATADPGMSYTIMTSSRRTLQILDAVGFRVLDDHRWVWRRTGPPPHRMVLHREPADVRTRLDGAGCRLLDDHTGLPVTPLLAEVDGVPCLVLLSIKRKAGGVLWFDVLHVGDAGFLARHGGDLANALLPASEAAVLAADCRLVAGTPGDAGRESLPVPRFYRSARLARRDIDHLYTELQLLDLKLD